MNPTKAIDRLYYNIILNELRMMNESGLYHSITYNSLLYLDLISYTENCTVSFLANALGIAKSSVTLKVSELMKQGLVEKRQSEHDRRVYFLTVRPEILKEFQKLDRATDYAVEQVQNHYSSEEIDRFCGMLDAFSGYYHDYTEMAKG
ncbi:MarR family transcriptional regulator [Lachnospiraceae bacterium 54-53]